MLGVGHVGDTPTAGLTIVLQSVAPGVLNSRVYTWSKRDHTPIGPGGEGGEGRGGVGRGRRGEGEGRKRGGSLTTSHCHTDSPPGRGSHGVLL